MAPPQPRWPRPLLARSSPGRRAPLRPRRAGKSAFRPLRRRQGSRFTFKAARGLLGRPAGWGQRGPLAAAGPSEPGRAPGLERAPGPSGRRRSARADRAGRGGSGSAGLGAGRLRARPAGAPGPPAGGGAVLGAAAAARPLRGEGSAGRRASLWEGSSWAGPEGTGSRRSPLPCGTGLRSRRAPGEGRRGSACLVGRACSEGPGLALQEGSGSPAGE